MTEAASEDHDDDDHASIQEHGQGEGGHHDAHDDDEHEKHAPPARDWIERFSQSFRASKHVHLEKGNEREMLPWLRLSAELDPHNVDTYVVSSYWLRKRLNKVDEAEQFLRDGLKANPNDPEILNELAWLLFENRKDLNRSGNLWRVALRRWHEVEDSKEEPDKPLLRAILTGLYELAMAQQQTNTAVGYLKQLKEISPNPELLQQRIDDLLQGKPSALRP
jgi:tetratricopeptide (TPR) repeat protein